MARDLTTSSAETRASGSAGPEAGTLTITATGHVSVSLWPAGGLLEHAYEQIETHLVGAVTLGDLTLWYDDEGRFKDEPHTNELATKLCGIYGPLVSDIVGTVLITGDTDDEGDTRPLTAEQLHELGAILEQLRPLPMPPIHRNLW